MSAMTETPLYHIGKGNVTRRCRAQLEPCKLQHFDTLKAAKDEAKRLDQIELDALAAAPEPKHTKKPTPAPNKLTQEDLEAMPREQQQQLMAAGFRYILDRAEAKVYQRAFEDTGLGQTVEFRRVQWSETMYEEGGIDSTPSQKAVADHDLPLRPIPTVENVLSTDLYEAGSEIPLSDLRGYKRIENNPQVLAMRTNLAAISVGWMSSLTPDEIQTINWMSSDGAHNLGEYIRNGYDPSNGLMGRYSERYLAEQEKLFRSAMAKAPELDEPVVIYRGTHQVDFESVNSPQSCSGSEAVAFGFGPREIVEIKTKKMPALMAMSQYSSEMEVLAPLGEYKKLGSITVRREINDGEWDDVLIHQYEFVG